MAVFICQGCGAEHATWSGRCPGCGTTETIRLAQSSDKMIDKVIKDKFKIIRKLGQGGMGAVYLAEQVGIGHRVALKFLKAEFSTDPEIARRFLNEAKSYARVAHPNAVALHDFGQDDEGNLFIAMEYCEGVDLKKVIAENGRLSVIEGIDVVLQVADVLANAHDKGVIHRDLKPENIMIRRGMRGVHAKVLDFGIARLMDAGTKLTQAGAIAGTPRYMSPEQVEGKEVDLRADIYSLGIVLFECLTGRQPFDGNTIAEILRKQAFEPLPHLSEMSADLDYPDLDAVVQRACSKRRDERWADMLAFADALSQATPTQAHIGLTPLEKSKHNNRAVSMATPAPMRSPTPGVGTVPNSTPASTSGMAIPGAAADASSTEGTLLRTGETPAHQRATDFIDGTAISSPRMQPPAVIVSPTLANPTVTDGRSAGVTAAMPAGDFTRPMPSTSATPGPLAGDLSIAPPPARKSSSAPIIAGVSAVAVVGVVVVALLVSNKSPAADPVAQPPPVQPTTTTAATTTTNTTAEKLSDEVRRAIEETKVKGDYTRGSDEFGVGNLDEAETFLLKVPPSSELHANAATLLEKIKRIRAMLAQAEGARRSGHCEQALPLYARVLKENGSVKQAIAGSDQCRASTVAPVMLP